MNVEMGETFSTVAAGRRNFVLAIDQAQEAALENEAEHKADRHGDESHQQEAGLSPAAVPHCVRPAPGVFQGMPGIWGRPGKW